MVTIATDTFATSMQLYPRQPHLSRGTDLLMKTISIRLWHMESPTGLSQAPFKMRFPKVHYRTSSFCCLFISPLVRLSKHPPKDKQDFNRFREASSQIIFPFQTKFPLLEIHFPPYSNPHPHPKVICSSNRPWCSSLNGIRASPILFIKNFFLQWSPHFFTFELLSCNSPKKVHAIAVAPHPPPLTEYKSRRHMNPVFSN